MTVLLSFFRNATGCWFDQNCRVANNMHWTLMRAGQYTATSGNYCSSSGRTSYADCRLSSANHTLIYRHRRHQLMPILVQQQQQLQPLCPKLCQSPDKRLVVAWRAARLVLRLYRRRPWQPVSKLRGNFLQDRLKTDHEGRPLLLLLLLLVLVTIVAVPRHRCFQWRSKAAVGPCAKIPEGPLVHLTVQTSNPHSLVISG